MDTTFSSYSGGASLPTDVQCDLDSTGRNTLTTNRVRVARAG